MTQDEMTSPFMVAEKFSIEVEKRALSNKSTLLEALAEVAEEMDIDQDDIKSYLSPTLLQKLEAECSRAGLFKTKEEASLEVFLK